jgi:hypothetical protein
LILEEKEAELKSVKDLIADYSGGRLDELKEMSRCSSAFAPSREKTGACD